MTGIRNGSPDDLDDLNEEPEMICPVLGSYCTGQFCDEYGCAKALGFWDDEA